MVTANLDDMYPHLWCVEIFETRKGKSEPEPNKKQSIFNKLMKELLKSQENICEKITKQIGVKAVFDAEEVPQEEDGGYIKFPVLHLSESDEYKTKIKIRVNPCLGGSPNSKVVIGVVGCNVPQNKITNDLFTQYKKFAEIICNIISETYSEKIKKHIPCSEIEFSKITKYYLYTLIIGSESKNFRELIENASNRDKMTKIIKRYETTNLRKGIDIISTEVGMRDFTWFTRKLNDFIGYFGFFGTENQGDFVGLTYGEPTNMVNGLLREVIRKF